MSRHPARLGSIEHMHRSQAERVATMRARLLDATITCLDERGYGDMSTNDVVRQARVSRGALAHHFPTKAELVLAAAQRLVDQRAADFRQRFGALPPRRRTPAEALAVLWTLYDGPGCAALVELTVAARHKSELKAVLAPMSERIAEVTGEVFAEFFPELSGQPFVAEALRAVHATFAGLALGAMASEDGHERAAEVRAFLKILVSALPQPTATAPHELIETRRTR